MTLSLLSGLALALPLLALVFEYTGNARISERHHSHHDTYTVSAEFTRSIVSAMVCMGLLGVILAWLCDQRLFHTSPLLVLAFYDALLLTFFLMWIGIRRYRVSTFDDSMMVVPFVGRRTWVRYNEIERLEWSGVRSGSGYRNLDVWVGGRHVATLHGIVDVEQILMNVDRFDLLPNNP